MTSYKEALNWFFQWERSKIVGTELEQRLQDIFNPSISETDREKLLHTLVEEDNNSSVMPELLFQIGAWYRKLSLPQKGLKYLDQAIEKYTEASDLHHRNSLHWLYGCILWQIGSHLDACLHWRHAIKVWKEYLPSFMERQRVIDLEIEQARIASLRCIEREEWHRKQGNLPGADPAQHQSFIVDYQQKAQAWKTKITELKKTRLGVTTKREWYQKRIEEMEIALLGTPEEAYLLVKDIPAQNSSRLDHGFINQREVIEDLIVDHKPSHVLKEVERMLAVAKAWAQPEEAGAYLVAGWAYYKIKNENWEKQLNKAIFSCSPDTPTRVWARWLLGAIQWEIPERVTDAATNWTIAIQDLANIRKKVEWQNQSELVEYYTEKLIIMRGVLDLQRNHLPSMQQVIP